MKSYYLLPSNKHTGPQKNKEYNCYKLKRPRKRSVICRALYTHYFKLTSLRTVRCGAKNKMALLREVFSRS